MAAFILLTQSTRPFSQHIIAMPIQLHKTIQTNLINLQCCGIIEWKTNKPKGFSEFSGNSVPEWTPLIMKTYVLRADGRVRRDAAWRTGVHPTGRRRKTKQNQFVLYRTVSVCNKLLEVNHLKKHTFTADRRPYNHTYVLLHIQNKTVLCVCNYRPNIFFQYRVLWYIKKSTVSRTYENNFNQNFM